MTTARDRLLCAAPGLAVALGYDEVSIAQLCRAAGVEAATFRAAFGDLPGYFEALQAAFLESMRTRMLKVIAGTQPGLLRVKLASEAYLGFCLETMPVRRWLIAARAHPALLSKVRQQSHNYALLLGAELRASGLPHPLAAARLLIAMLNEVASVELHTMQRQPEHREALWHFLDHTAPSAASARNAA